MTPRRAALSALVAAAVLFALVATVRLCTGSAPASRAVADDERSDADTFLPTTDAEVLEQLPAGDTAEVRRFRARLGHDAGDLDAAVALARRQIEASRARSDPRLLGHAQAALAPWWRLPSPPIEVLLLRATIRQSQHDFAGALADLDDLVARAPGHAQGHLTRAVVSQVRGDYAAARESCAALVALAAPLVVAACRAGVDGLTGRAAEAAGSLEGALDASVEAAPAERAWAHTLLAELGVRRGDPSAAERHYRAALALSPDDGYLLASHADFLLDGGRAAEVVTLLRGHEDADGLLLRLAIGARRVGAGAAARHIADLRARFDAGHARGDRIHLREEARFALELEDDAPRAVQLAVENWNVQHEPADARLLLEAARAAGTPEAAAPVVAWLAETGIEDPMLTRLAREVEAR